MFPLHKQGKTVSVERLEYGTDEVFPEMIFLRDDASVVCGRVAYARTDIDRDLAWKKSKEKAWLASEHLELVERLLAAGHYIEAAPIVQTAAALCRDAWARAPGDRGQS